MIRREHKYVILIIQERENLYLFVYVKEYKNSVLLTVMMIRLELKNRYFYSVVNKFELLEIGVNFVQLFLPDDGIRDIESLDFIVGRFFFSV